MLETIGIKHKYKYGLYMCILAGNNINIRLFVSYVRIRVCINSCFSINCINYLIVIEMRRVDIVYFMTKYICVDGN